MPRSLKGTAFVPLEVYLDSSVWEPDAEYVDGVIEERSLPKYDHAKWQFIINLWFQTHRYQWNVRALPELRVQVSSTRVRIPDVTVLDRSLPIEQVITIPPVAVFEVLSPDDSTDQTDFIGKLEDYHAMGIPQIWVVNPEDHSFYRYQDRQMIRQEVYHDKSQGIAFAFVEIESLLHQHYD